MPPTSDGSTTGSARFRRIRLRYQMLKAAHAAMTSSTPIGIMKSGIFVYPPTEDEQQLRASVTRIGAGYLESLGSRLPNSTPATREPPVTENPATSTTASAARPHHISMISRRLNHSWFGWCDRSRDGRHHRGGRRDESRSAAPDLHAISTFPSCNGRSDGGC